MEQEKFYPKNYALLASMAMRSNHSFGICEKEEKQEMIEAMDHLYDLYISGKTNEEMSAQTRYGVVSISQIREEVNGKGFFNPER